MTLPETKILAVDDNPQNLMALRAVLALEGCELLTAHSGNEALETLLQHEVALALLDVQMPGMDGYALAELMRGPERTRHVPIIFLTAGARDEARHFRGYEAGAVDFLFKPLDSRVLRSKVQVFVDLYRQRLLLAERMAERERLLQLNATMLSALSHDIRAPLTALALNAELLIRRSDSVGRRVKAATTMLARQVDHLVNLASLPRGELRPQLAPCDLAALVAERLENPSNASLLPCPFVFVAEGDGHAQVDRNLVAGAIDHLLLQAATHSGEGGVRVALDGSGRRVIALRIAFDTVLCEAAALHLFGSAVPLEGVAVSHVGSGLAMPERVARAHGGSLIGHTREREGTLFEMLLPRGTVEA